jgi:hypothetical protein
MLAYLSLIAFVIASIALIVVGAKQVKLGQELAAIERARFDRETRAWWEVRATDQTSWSMDSPNGPIRELAAEVTNAGGIDSPPVTVRALIDGAQVGRSSPRPVVSKTVATFNVPMDQPTKLRGLLRLEVVGSGGNELATSERRLSRPDTSA